jgi:hypothetical protein
LTRWGIFDSLMRKTTVLAVLASLAGACAEEPSTEAKPLTRALAQTGWTGIVARLLDFFARTDAASLLAAAGADRPSPRGAVRVCGRRDP